MTSSSPKEFIDHLRTNRVATAAPVIKVLSESDRHYVLFDPGHWRSDDPASARNLACYSADGALLWLAEDHMCRAKSITGTIKYESYYSLWLEGTPSKLWAGTRRMSFLLDKDSGKIVRSVIDDR
jgi:hypothetical protein